MAKQGLFVTFEGIHGTGKSTIVMRLTKKLSEQGYPTIYLSDQAGTPVGNELRKINLGFENLAPFSEALIVAASRHQSIREVIKPNLQKGAFIICERFTDAFLAYEFARKSMAMSLAVSINTAVADGVRPDLTILLDVNPIIAIERIPPEERHRFEKENMDFHSRLREGYRQLAMKYPERIKVVDGGEMPDSVFANVLKMVTEAIHEWEER